MSDFIAADLEAKYRFYGGPWDRGGADSWYSRPKDPHWYPDGTHAGRRVEAHEMTQEELAAYEMGYEENERSGGKKF